MEKTLLDILAINQSFDAALRVSPTVASIIARYAAAILYETNEKKRAAAIALVAADLNRYYKDAVQPAARKIAVANARKVIDALPGKPSMSDPMIRRTILHEMDARTDDRLRIVQAMVADKTNTLENRLVAYYLEPGHTAEQKIAQLRQLHAQQVEARANYESKLSRYLSSPADTQRPARPRLDFDQRLVLDVREGFREQAKRAGTDAVTGTFTDAGYELLAWITVNAGQACAPCRKRQGMIGNTKFWDMHGRPGTADTFCMSSCCCLLVPAEILIATPKLADGLDSSVSRQQ